MNNIRIFDKNETSFAHNGIKVLHPTSCTITRNLFDYTYELDMEHPIDDSNVWKEITEGRIIKANNQYFRICHTSTSVFDNSLTVYAKHIFFDLQNNFIEDTNIVSKNGNMALAQLLGATSFTHDFSSYSDISGVNNLRCVRKNVLDALLGSEDNTFINRWGGEFDADNFSIKFVNQLGSDNGYSISYGKNLTGLTSEVDYTGIVTRIRPVGFDGIELPDNNKYVDSAYIGNYAMPIIKEYKYENVKWSGSPNYEEKEDETATVFDDLSLAQAELMRLASLEFTENEVDLPKVTCEINFVELSHTEEYLNFQNLQKISLGDIVTIRHKPLDINVKARCISYVYDCILDKYESVTIGSYQKNFFKETASTNEKMENNDFDISEQFQSVYTQAITKMSEMMNNSMNGYVVLSNSEILIMDTPDKTTATNVWKFNSSGIAHSSTGYEGEYTVGMTMDGHINGALITAGTIKGDMLEAGSITTRELAVEIQTTINSAMTQETTQALITANLNQFESNLSQTFITEEEATKQIQDATEVAVEQATQEIVNTSVEKAMESVNDQLDNKLSDYTTNTMNPALQQSMQETLQDSKDYVVEVTGNYYTKNETDSKISQTREEIELGVSSTYETKENTSIKITEAIDGVTVGAINRVFGTAEEKSYTFTGKGNDAWWVYDISPDISDKEVIISFEYDLEATVENNSALRYETYYLSTSNQATYLPKYEFLSWDSYQNISLKNQQVSFTGTHPALQQNAKFRFRADGIIGTFTIRKAQIKVGNKITEWSIAPEDIENNANNYTVQQLTNYYTKNQTDSMISIVKDEINLGVSSIYETKVNVTTAINDVKKYSDTKKNEAITSANNTLKTTISNYYTKDETNSAINIAKNEINLNVSSTYETKTNTTTKVNDALSQAKSYSNIKKNEAITSANDTLKTTIANYYTKEQTDSQINIAKNEINLGVSSTYETKTEVENKINNISIGGRNLIRGSQDFVSDGSRIKGFSIDSLFKKTIEDGFAVMTAYQSGYQSANIRSIYSSCVPCKKGDIFTISVWFKVQDISLWDYRCPYIWEVYNSGGTRIEYQDVDVNANNSNKPVLINNKWIRFTSTHTVTDTNASKCAIRLTLFRNGTISFKQPQIERGNKTTDWSPNPQDIEDNANNYTLTRLQSYYTKEETNSQINIAKDSIKSEVSNTYYTKNEISSSGATNLIKNGGFEKGLEYWQTNQSPSFNLNQSWQNYDGKSIFISTDSYGDGIYQIFKTEIGKTYTYSFYAQCEKCEFTVGVENRHTQKVAVSPNRWTYYQGTFTATANHHAFIIYNLNQNTQGNIFIDNIMINEGVIPAKYTLGYSEVYESIANNTSLINQTASAIRSEISSSFSSYYNKNETDNKIYNATSSVTQTINDLKIQFSQSGGYNLFKNSKFHGGQGFWGNQSYNSPSGGVGFMGYASYWGFPDREVNTIYYTLPIGKSNVEWGLAQNVETTIGKQYTISFYYAAHRCTSANIIVRRSNGSWLANQSFNPSNYSGGNWSANNWGRQVFTFTATESSHTINIVMNNCNDSNDSGYFWIAKPQCEEGSVATAWSPHPNEVMTGITTISEHGITVSHSNANTTSSMDASGFKITRTSDGKNIFNATNGNLAMEGVLSTGSSGRRIVASDSNYKVYDGNTQKAFFGLRNNDGYVSPMLSLSADAIGTTSYDGFSINMYKRNNNPSSSTVDYMDMSYLVSSKGDYSNLKMFGDGNIRISPVKDLEISTNYYNGSYNNPNGYEYVIAKFTSIRSNYYNARLEIDAIVNTDMTSNGQGLVLEDSRGGSWSSVTVYVNPSTGQRTFRPVTAQTGTVYNGTSNALWKVVYSANGTIQTSDRRYKAITDDTDIYDCFKMVKNTKIHNYVMLDKNKEKMTQIELAESALFNVGEESSVQIGVMAQDLLNYKCGKQIVVHEDIKDDDGNVVDDIYSVNAYPFASAVMGGLQYEIKQREELSNIVLNLCQTILDLQQRVEDLEEK